MSHIYKSFAEAENELREAFSREPNNTRTRFSEVSLNTGFGKLNPNEVMSDDNRFWGMNPERFWILMGK